MLMDPILAKELAQERMKDLMREAEQDRLIRRAAKGSRRAHRWWFPVALNLTRLLGRVIGRRVDVLEHTRPLGATRARS